MNTRHTALLAAALSAAACAAPPAAEPATAQQMADLINQARALGRTCGKTYYPAAEMEPPARKGRRRPRAGHGRQKLLPPRKLRRPRHGRARRTSRLPLPRRRRKHPRRRTHRPRRHRHLAGPPATAKTSWIQPTPKSAWPTPPTSIPNTASIGCRISEHWRGSEKGDGLAVFRRPLADNPDSRIRTSIRRAP